MNQDQKRPSVSVLARAGLTGGWIIIVGVFLRWWELTLRFPSVLLWTVVLLTLFVGTAVIVMGNGIWSRRHPVWKRAGLWLGLVVMALLMPVFIPEVRIGGTPVRAVAFAGLLDVVIPFWIAVIAISLLWERWARVLVLTSISLLLLIGMWVFVVRMPGNSYSGSLHPLTVEQEERRTELKRHVSKLAAEIGDRSAPDGARRAVSYIDNTLTAMGFDVLVQEFEVAGGRHRNLEVVVPGVSRPEETVVVGAHYDTVDGTPGADDNASGVAGVLELARWFATHPMAKTIKFVLFTNEEPPFFATEGMGSYAYAKRAAKRGERIVAMLSLETIGYYTQEPGSQRYPQPFSFFYPDRGNFIGFVGNLSSGRLLRRSLATFRREARFPSEGVAAPTWIPGITWSDHASFWQHGFKAIMITDTAPFRNPYYHNWGDTLDKLDFDRMARVVDGIAAVVRELAD